MQHSGKYTDPKARFKNLKTCAIFYAQEWAGEIVATPDPAERAISDRGSRRYSIEAFEARFVKVSP